MLLRMSRIFRDLHRYKSGSVRLRLCRSPYRQAVLQLVDHPQRGVFGDGNSLPGRA